jgi:hypothetical protein
MRVKLCLKSLINRRSSRYEFFLIRVGRIMIYLDNNRFFPRICQNTGSSCEASVLSYLLNEDYNNRDDANGDIDGDHCKIAEPPTQGSESGTNYQLSDGTSG